MSEERLTDVLKAARYVLLVWMRHHPEPLPPAKTYHPPRGSATVPEAMAQLQAAVDAVPQTQEEA